MYFSGCDDICGSMITAMDLIGRGYFPKELPPAFTTDSLANHTPLLQGIIPVEPRKSKCYKYSIPRVKTLRRELKIPNPQNQIKLCDCIAIYWAEIEDFLSKSSLSLSRPIKDTGKRSLTTIRDLKELPIELVHQSVGYRYKLHVDIANYYSNIYTHSIPWAYCGKERSKANRNKILLANKIDRLIQNLQDGQTIGIPTGPDTSLVISEIIGTAIDLCLCKEIPNLRGVRYIDDYFLYFMDKDEANDALVKIHKIISDFELNINHSKIQITELPDYSRSIKWLYELSMYEFSESHQNSDIYNYFNKAFELSALYPEDYVLRYALGRIKNLKIFQDNWEIYESFILNSIMAEPSVLPIATNILYTYYGDLYPLNMDKISNMIYKFVQYHSKYSHINEIVWALWLVKMLNIELKKSIVKSISLIQDSAIALIALDLYCHGLIEGGLDRSNWMELMTGQQLYDNNWLLSYEAYHKGWLNSKKGVDYIEKDKFFSYLSNNDIHFYDVNKMAQTYELENDGVREPEDYNILTY